MPRLSFSRQGAAAIIGAALLAACSSTPTKTPSASAPPTQSSKYYKDDGPGDSPPANLEQIPDAVPRLEPLHRYANRPYTVLGRDYVPAVALRNYRERGIASWYGRKFHGQKTSIGETYDMYGMTAAHPTLPLPSFARVTNVATGRSVIVRVNDRGPFLHGRIIDLSFAAASKVGIAGKGSGEVEVEAIIPGDDGVVVATAPLPPVAAAAVPVAASPATGTAPLRPAEAPPAAISRDGGGFAVQLGAFQNLNNAQTFLAHAEAQLGSAQVTPRVREANGLYRVYVGPYPDRDEARRVADRITTAFGFATAIAPH
ncbi:MAG: septal ring lytic transglycosylase RlpA family protein [Casimicrobiaceae bacterium]